MPELQGPRVHRERQGQRERQEMLEPQEMLVMQGQQGTRPYAETGLSNWVKSVTQWLRAQPVTQIVRSLLAETLLSTYLQVNNATMEIPMTATGVVLIATTRHRPSLTAAQQVRFCMCRSQELSR